MTLMRKPDIRGWVASLSDIYSTRDENAKGRLISLGSNLAAVIYNVFITGIFYTGFLSMYGMSITNVGIISFIPYIASTFSVFSASVLRRFKRKKPILLASKIFFYAMYILATMWMPRFVEDPEQRLLWFVIILFVAYAVYAVFSPGITAWFYDFYPADNERRTRYITLNQTFSSILSSAVMILSSILTDAVAGSPHQASLILGFRYLAFGMVVLDVAMQAFARENPTPDSARFRLSKVFTLPFTQRKFLCCVLVMFAWNFISNLNNGLWNYHLLNHMHFSYTVMSAMSVAYTVILVLSSTFWRRLLRRYSWIKTFGLANLVWVPTEFFFFFMTAGRTWMYVPLGLIQNFIQVGFNLAYANVLYMNLPAEDSTAYISFHAIGCNVFAFLGLLFGTWISSLTGDDPVWMLGMPVYSVQFTTIARGICMGALGWVLVRHWRSFTREQDILDVEEHEALLRAQRERRRQLLRRM